jgi:hypothetical protein
MGGHEARPNLSPADEPEYQRNDKENDGYPEKEPCTFHRRTGNAAEAQKCRDKRDNEKYNGPVQQIAHRTNSRAFDVSIAHSEGQSLSSCATG